jgi:ribosomal protein S18 acetylase RimI-like enzyme
VLAVRLRDTHDEAARRKQVVVLDLTRLIERLELGQVAGEGTLERAPGHTVECEPRRLLVPVTTDVDDTDALTHRVRVVGEEVHRMHVDLAAPGAVNLVLVAELDGSVVGYSFAAVEGDDYMALRGPAGVLHDIVVDPDRRGGGVGRTLLEATVAALAEAGAPRVVLSTEARNETAQRRLCTSGERADRPLRARDFSLWHNWGSSYRIAPARESAGSALSVDCSNGFVSPSTSPRATASAHQS